MAWFETLSEAEIGEAVAQLRAALRPLGSLAAGGSRSHPADAYEPDPDDPWEEAAQACEDLERDHGARAGVWRRNAPMRERGERARREADAGRGARRGAPRIAASLDYLQPSRLVIW